MPVQALLIVPADEPRAERRSVRVDPGEVRTIGRSRSCDIVLSDANVSGVHAEVRIEDERLVFRDAESRNGTWLVGGDDERRLEPGEEAALDPDAAVRIGPYQLVPCELLGDGVALTSSIVVDAPTVTTTARDGARETPDESQARSAVAALTGALAAIDTEAEPHAIWRAVLHGLLMVADADRGFLLSLSGERFLLRAARGDGSISRSFLEATAERNSSWDLVPAAAVSEGKASPSIRLYGSDVVLTGVPFRSGSGATIAVGCLERTQGELTDTGAAVDSYASLAGRVLELAEALDRERRGRQALEARQPRAAGQSAAAPAPPRRVALIGGHASFREAVATVERAAGSGVHLLIRGPSGSGKEQLAQLAHEAGDRHGQPFVVLNCAALPESLVESELFGADRGAYTGADRGRAGAFEQGDGGTLFLDEIGDLPLAAQAKILRAIESGEIVRVGGSRKQVDVRLVTATHRDLEAMVAEGTFREDLYYRLRVIEVTLPSLAERGEDLLPLAEHFLGRSRRPDGSSVQGISVRAAKCMQAYAWPGNVRELRNVIDRAVVLDRDGVLDLDDLPAEIRALTGERVVASDGGFGGLLESVWPEAKRRFEEIYFRAALDRHDGAVQETAKATGVDRRTLSTKIAQHGLKGKSD